MKLIDDTVEVLAGLNDTGGVVEFFASPDDFENRDDATISIGIIIAIPTDYEEIFAVKTPDQILDESPNVISWGTGDHYD